MFIWRCLYSICPYKEKNINLFCILEYTEKNKHKIVGISYDYAFVLLFISSLHLYMYVYYIDSFTHCCFTIVKHFFQNKFKSMKLLNVMFP